MSRNRTIVSLLFLVSLFVPAVAQSFPTSVVDDRGQEIVIRAEPQRIVAVGALYAQVLVDLGAMDRLVGIADSADNPAEVLGFASVGPTFAPSIEAILALDPDLVLGATDWGGERPAIEAAGVPVLTTPLLASLSDVLASIVSIGTAVGTADSAAALAESIAMRIIALESEILSRSTVPAAFLYMSAPNDPPYVAGSGTIEGELILRAGGVNVFSDVPSFPQVSIEELLARDPQVIFTDPSQVSFVLTSSHLRGSSAVVSGRVIGIHASLATSTRVADVLAWMIEALHGTP